MRNLTLEQLREVETLTHFPSSDKAQDLRNRLLLIQKQIDAAQQSCQPGRQLVELSVPSFNGSEHDENNRATVHVTEEAGLRIDLGSPLVDRGTSPDLLIERQTNGWLIFIHPESDFDPSGIIAIADRELDSGGRTFAFPDGLPSTSMRYATADQKTYMSVIEVLRRKDIDVQVPFPEWMKLVEQAFNAKSGTLPVDLDARQDEAAEFYNRGMSVGEYTLHLLDEIKHGVCD
jgi:hypothetical protein